MFKHIVLIICFVIATKAFFDINRSVQFRGKLKCDGHSMENDTVKFYQKNMIFSDTLLGEKKTNSSGEVSITDKKMVWINMNLYAIIEHKCGLSSNSSCLIQDNINYSKDKLQDINGTLVWDFKKDFFNITTKTGKIDESFYRVVNCGVKKTSS